MRTFFSSVLKKVVQWRTNVWVVAHLKMFILPQIGYVGWVLQFQVRNRFLFKFRRVFFPYIFFGVLLWRIPIHKWWFVLFFPKAFRVFSFILGIRTHSSVISAWSFFTFYAGYFMLVFLIGIHVFCLGKYFCSISNNLLLSISKFDCVIFFFFSPILPSLNMLFYLLKDILYFTFLIFFFFKIPVKSFEFWILTLRTLSCSLNVIFP